jgi:hypothetical protein
MDISISMKAYLLYSCFKDIGGFLFNKVENFGDGIGLISFFHPSEVAL